jgi:hypothetical protein
MDIVYSHDLKHLHPVVLSWLALRAADADARRQAKEGERLAQQQGLLRVWEALWRLRGRSGGGYSSSARYDIAAPALLQLLRCFDGTAEANSLRESRRADYERQRATLTDEQRAALGALQAAFDAS